MMRTSRKNVRVLTLAVLALGSSLLTAGSLPPSARGAEGAGATDWPQYRGPEHNGISQQKVALPWPQSGPAVVWKVPTPDGFSSFTVSGGMAYTLVLRDDKETCVALDAATGKEAWAGELSHTKYSSGGNSGTPDNNGGDGPRSTPVVNDGLVYVYSSDLVLYCFDAKSGKQQWKIDMTREYSGKNVQWSNASSPVIDGDMLFVMAGGRGQSFLALNKKTGKPIWKGQDDAITHATPVVGEILGQKQVIFFTQKGLAACDTTSGKLLWRYPFKYAVSTAASPVICGDIVYCSAGYDVGGGAVKITHDGSEWTAKEIWRVPGNKNIANHWSTPVYKDGYLYGMFSFKRYGVGPMKCVDVASGKVVWDKPGFGAGQVIMADGKLLALADDGELVAVDPSPAAYKEISRFQAIAGKCWSTPALSDGKVYIRSTKEGACLDLAGK